MKRVKVGSSDKILSLEKWTSSFAPAARPISASTSIPAMPIVWLPVQESRKVITSLSRGWGLRWGKCMWGVSTWWWCQIHQIWTDPAPGSDIHSSSLTAGTSSGWPAGHGNMANQTGQRKNEAVWIINVTMWPPCSWVLLQWLHFVSTYLNGNF